MPCTVMLFSSGIASGLFARKLLCCLSLGGDIVTALISDELRTSQEPPFDFRRAYRRCRFPIPAPRSLPVTKSNRAIHRILLTASHLVSSQKFHVSVRHL